MKKKRKPKRRLLQGALPQTAAADDTEGAVAPASKVLSRRARMREGAATRAAAAAEASGGAGPPKGKAKKRRLQEEDDDDDEDDEEGDDDEDGEDDADEDEESGEIGEVDFEFFDPTEDDYHSVGDLIKNGLFEFVELNFAELSDCIVGQGNIGTVIKSESDAGGAGGDKENTVCGVLTTLNLRQFAKQSWPKTLGAAMLKKAEKNADAEVVQKLKGYLQHKDGSEVGLLVSERFVNLPLQLIPALHRALLEDIEWSCSTKECPPEEKPFYDFTNFIGIARCFQVGKPGAAGAAAPKGKRRKAAAAATSSEAEPVGAGGFVWPRPEDELYFAKAAFSFAFPVSASGSGRQRGESGVAGASKGGSGRGQEMRAIFGLTRKAFDNVVKEMAASPKFVPDGEEE